MHEWYNILFLKGLYIITINNYEYYVYFLTEDA